MLLPENAHWDRDTRGVQEVVCMSCLQPRDLHNGGCHHGDGHDSEPNAHALQAGEPAPVSCVGTRDGHKHTVVDWGATQDTDEVEEGDGRWRYVDVTDMRVHGGTLFNEQGEHLSVDGGEDYAGDPDG